MRLARLLQVSRIVQGPVYLWPELFVGSTATVSFRPGRDSQLDPEPSGEHLGADCAEEGNTGQFPGAGHAAAAPVPLVLSGQGWQSANRRNSAVIKV